ncbi:hypothetical protein KR51_00024830 [Rubidibacter lacunae KORDI 51-2]|uniref:Uncharacterized protein n=1 Tax=Rubidibacter lacunae KORDI 51-2 TaxID=582515 RepID=U5D8P6_9CHRO|nr:hypothetical protein KR51_00024830 [Rubidibacter lacunae KORDI 51-2]
MQPKFGLREIRPPHKSGFSVRFRLTRILRGGVSTGTVKILPSARTFPTAGDSTAGDPSLLGSWQLLRQVIPAIANLQATDAIDERVQVRGRDRLLASCRYV